MAFAHTVDLVLTEVVGDIIDLLLDRLDLLQGKVTVLRLLPFSEAPYLMHSFRP